MNSDRRRIILLAVLFMLSIGNYARIKGNESVRTIQFLSIFIIGFLTAMLVVEIGKRLRNKNQ